MADTARTSATVVSVEADTGSNTELVKAEGTKGFVAWGDVIDLTFALRKGTMRVGDRLSVVLELDLPEDLKDQLK